jgi:antitoxin component of MazEF toxin-antitoxin module
MTLALKSKSPVIVPPAVLRQAGFRSGEELVIKASGGVITIVPKRPHSKPNGAETLAERRAINRSLAASDKDYHEGRVYGPFSTTEEMAESIEANIRKLRASKRKIKSAR